MKKQFQIFKIYRKSLVETIDDLNIEQLQKIPEGFKNSIFWNVAHTLVIQQIMQYRLSGLDLLITNDWVENYKKGTHPRFTITENEKEYLKGKLISTAEQLEEDYNEKKFVTFSEYNTEIGVALSSIEDAINYNNVHEGIHFGIVKTMKKIII